MAHRRQGIALLAGGVTQHLQAHHQGQILAAGPELGRQGDAAQQAQFLLVKGHQPDGPPGRLPGPVLRQLHQGRQSGGIVIGAGGMQRPVVVGSHQQGGPVRLAARQAQNQVAACLGTNPKAMLFKRAERGKQGRQLGAYGQQGQAIPVAVAGPGPPLQLDQQALLQTGGQGLGAGRH